MIDSRYPSWLYSVEIVVLITGLLRINGLLIALIQTISLGLMFQGMAAVVVTVNHDE
jgi:hypothetical protein